MNDITALAQRMNAAALNATGAHERLSVMPEGWSGDMAKEMKGYIVEFLRECNGFRSH